MPTERKLPMPATKRRAGIERPCFCCHTTLLSIDQRFSCRCATNTLCVKLEHKGCGRCLEHCLCLAAAGVKTAEAKAKAEAEKERLKMRQPWLFGEPEKRRKK